MSSSAPDAAQEETTQFQRIRDADHCAQILRDIYRQGSPLKVITPKGKQARSLLLAVKNDFLVLDQLLPHPGSAPLPRGTPLHCVVNHNGVLIRFDTEVRSRGLRDGVLLYKVDFPQAVERRQRRSAFRVPVPLGFDYRAELHDPQMRYRLCGEIADLSGQGLAVRIRQAPPEMLEPGQRIPEVRLQLDDPTRPLQCRLELRSLREVKQGVWILGCRFDGLTPAQQTLIDRLVFALEREYRKRQQAAS